MLFFMGDLQVYLGCLETLLEESRVKFLQRMYHIWFKFPHDFWAIYVQTEYSYLSLEVDIGGHGSNMTLLVNTWKYFSCQRLLVHE